VEAGSKIQIRMSVMENMISVIVPAYNVEKEIIRCLDSLSAQSYPNLEVVVVDDGSQDGTAEILDRYSAEHANIRVFHQENGGVTSARLRGVREAKGEWIGFVDGDDEVEPQMYDHLVQNALKYDARISHCGYRLVFPDGREKCFYNTGTLFQNDRIEGLRELLTGRMIEPGLCNKLFHRSLLTSFLEDGKMDMGIRINEDLLMNFYLFKAAERSVFEDFCPYRYLVRETSATRRGLSSKTMHDLIKVREYILEDIPKELENQAKCNYIGACVGVCSSIARADSREYKTEYRDAVRRIKEHLNWFPLLGRKLQIYVLLILCLGRFYGVLYRFYFNNLSKKPYD